MLCNDECRAVIKTIYIFISKTQSLCHVCILNYIGNLFLYLNASLSFLLAIAILK